MIKMLFSLIIILHGLIHLLGFFKAFNAGSITQLNAPISKPMGIIWLSVSILFLMTAVMYIMNVRSWPFIAISALVISQFVIFTVWSDAKFGTIANIIVLLAALPAIGNFMFSNMVENEQMELLEQVTRPSGRIITGEDFNHLPTIVQRWLHTSGVPDKPDVTFVQLRQTGEMKTEPDGRWMDFSAVQYFDAIKPSFVWKVDVRMMPLITLTGRDKLQDGQGEMLIKLFSLINVVNEQNNPRINTGTLIRYLGEICWFPSAALSETISWEEIGETSAKATLTIGGQQVSGVFRFGKNGEMRSYEAERYYGGADDAELRKWVVEAAEYKTFDGYRIPNKLSVTWKLPDGDFTWLNLEITDMNVNRFGRDQDLKAHEPL